MERECDRYGLDRERVAQKVAGVDPSAGERPKRGWWELLVAGGALAVFVWLAAGAERQSIAVNIGWITVLVTGSLGLLAVCGLLLWKRTRFS
jgi:hypothetical protein